MINFLKNNAVSIILVSIIFSLMTIFTTIQEIKYPDSDYVLKKEVVFTVER